MTNYTPGQELWRHDTNEDRLGGPTRVTVTKVARKLLTVQGTYGLPEVFRIDTGRTNDDYGHGWLCTDEEHAEHIARAATLDRLRVDHHMTFQAGAYSRAYPAATLAAVADLLDTAKENPLP